MIRDERDYIKIMLLVLLFLSTFKSWAININENFKFEGYWKVNSTITLNEITKQQVPNKEKWFLCYKTLLCGDFIYQFENDNFYTLFLDGNEYYRSLSSVYEIERKNNKVLLKIKSKVSSNLIEFEVVNENRMQVKLEGFYEIYDRVEADLDKKIIDYRD